MKMANTNFSKKCILMLVFKENVLKLHNHTVAKSWQLHIRHVIMYGTFTRKYNEI